MATAVLYPDGVVAAASWGPVGAASNNAATDDPIGAPDGDATYAQGSNSTWDYLIMSLGPMTDAVEILSITAWTIYNNAGAGASQEIDFGIRIGSTNYLNGSIAVVSSTYATASKLFTVNPATLAPWTKAQLDDLMIVNGTQDTSGAVDSVRVTSTYVTVEYQPIPAGISPAREIASHRLRLYRRPLEEMLIDVPLAMLDLELGDDFSVTQPAGPDSAGAGWGATNWKRRLHQLRSETIDLNNMTVSISSRGRRSFLCTDWDTAFTSRSSSAVEDGVARLGVGGTNTYTRASNMWVEDPGSRLVVLKAVNEKPMAYGGLLLESSATNLLTLSSNVAGSVSGLTIAGASGTVATETASTQPLFDASVTANDYLWTAGSPHTADLRASWPATASVGANTVTRVSIDYMDNGSVAGDRIHWRVRRAIDGNYWDDSGAGSWVAGATDNPLALAATRTRAISNRIDVGAGATALTFSMVLLNGGTAGRIARVYHVQLEDKAWATSRIVTTATTYTRALQTYTVTNTSGKRPLNSTGGTYLAQVVPLFSAADALAGNVDLYLLDMTYDASNWFRVYYDVSAGNLLFEIRAAGTTTTATKAWSPVRGTTYKIAARWTSSVGELDLTARTHSIFVDGVKGTDATRAADPTRTAADMYRGGNSAGAACNASYTRHLISQVVLTDAEIGRFQP
jgi:hypothetical protein